MDVGGMMCKSLNNVWICMFMEAHGGNGSPWTQNGSYRKYMKLVEVDGSRWSSTGVYVCIWELV